MIKNKKGVTVIICSLNSEKNLLESLESISNQSLKPIQIIIADGGSTDGTMEIASKFTEFFINSEPGFYNQVTKAIPLIQYGIVWTAEIDHTYPKEFLENLLKEHIKLDSDGTQGFLECLIKENYFERAFAYTYEKNQKSGKTDFISGPAIWNTDIYKEIYSELSKIKSPEKLLFSIDTFKAEVIRKYNYNCNRVDIVAHQFLDLDFNSVIKKYFQYGEGDYFYYRNLKEEWTFSRKVMSLSHVFRNHFLKLSLQALIDLKIQYIFFIIIITFYRYLGFFSKFFK